VFYFLVLYPFVGVASYEALGHVPPPPAACGNFAIFIYTFRGSAVERWSLAGELSLSYARPTADG